MCPDNNGGRLKTLCPNSFIIVGAAMNFRMHEARTQDVNGNAYALFL